ncbi:MAG: hypothetical protein CMA66_00940 [Euryarchaeota archaeon]|nr:hypothetical protein [Euryarchaeota archaeon]
MGARVKDSLYNYRLVSLNSWERIPRDPFILFGGNILASATATQIFISKAISYIAISAVTTWAIKALTPTPDFGAFGTSQGLIANTRTATAPQEIIYGTIRKGGVVSYVESTGDTNKFLHQIIVLGGHEVNGIGSVYINDATVTIGSDYFVSDARWKDADSNAKIYIRKFTGADNQNVYSTLNAITDPPEWKIDGVAPSAGQDTNFKGEGIACLYVRMEYDQNVFAEGIPLFTAIVEGKKVYDPRNSSTAFSANAALCIRDYLTSSYGVDNTGVTLDTTFSAAANACDETVTLSGGGTEKRYELNGVVSLDRSPSDILADMMTSCAATLFWGQGNWQLKVGEYTAAVKTFTLDDFRSGISVETKPSRRDSFNIVRGMFNSAADDYIRTDYPEIRSSTFITNDAGVESAVDLALPYTTSSAMAQRLAKMTLFRARESMTVSADFGLDAFNVQVGDVVGITNSRYGWSAKEFEVVGWKFSNDSSSGELSVSLTLRETSSAAFSWSAEESEILSNNSTLPSVGASLAIAALNISGGGRTAGDGTFIHSAIVSWTAPSNSFISHYEVEYKATSDSNYHSTTTTETSIELSPLVDAVEYTFRVRAVTVQGIKGSFVTATFTGGGDTTAPALPTAISATGGFKFITINWTNPTDSDLNFVEIYENSTNSSTGATKVGVSGGDTFTRTNLGLNQTKYYFLKSVDYTGNKSAFTTGVSATTTYLDDPDFENGIRQIFIDAGLDMIQPVSSLPSSGDFVGQNVYLTSDNVLYAWNGSSWAANTAGATSFSGLSGSIAIGQIPNSLITELKLADNSVTANKISANAVGANEIAANSITGNKIVANTITGGLLATAGIITNSAQIDQGIIGAASITDASITTAKIGNNVVTFPQMATGSSLTDVQFTDTALKTLVTLTVSNTGASAQVVANLFATHRNNNYVTASGEYRKFNYNLRKNGTSIAGLSGAMVGHFNAPSFTLQALDNNTSASTITYTLTVQNTGGNTSWTRFLYPTISYLELKK